MKTINNNINYKSLLFVVSLLISTCVLAQEPILLSHEGEPLGDTLIVIGFNTDYEIIISTKVHNNTDHSMDIKVKRTELQMIAGTSSYFCWGNNCYPPNLNVSTNSFALGSGESTAEEDFAGHYLTNENYGDSFIEYEFFNVNDETENAKVVVQFAATIVGTQKLIDTQFLVYPNPAINYVSIKSESTINRIEIHNQIGQLVKVNNTNGNVLSLNIADLKSGVYFMKAFSNGNVINKSLVIR